MRIAGSYDTTTNTQVAVVCQLLETLHTMNYTFMLHRFLTTYKIIQLTTIEETRLPASRSSSIGPEGCFSFLHPKVKVNKTIFLTSFVFWGLVGLKVLKNFKSFQGLLTNVFFTHTLPPLMLPGRGGIG